MSSVTEGLGTSLLDAMACGKPVVATTAGGIPEVVVDGETGLLVAPRDHSAMADAIVRLLKDDGLRARMGAAGLNRARKKFSAERMVQETVRVYKQVARHPHREETEESPKPSCRTPNSRLSQATAGRPAGKHNERDEHDDRDD